MVADNQASDQRTIVVQESLKKEKKETKEAQEKQIVDEGKMPDDKDARQAALRFQEQCHLMLNWELFVEKNKNKSYKNFFTIEHDKPYELTNNLFRSGFNADALLEAEPAHLSILVPEVRIYKSYVDPKSGEEALAELPFDDFTNTQKIENMTKTSAGRGGGVGLKSFNWKTTGKHVGNDFLLEAEMVLYFQNIEELFEIRDRREIRFGSNKKMVDISFSDLILPQATFRKTANEGPGIYNPDYFRVKAVVGWHVPRTRGVTDFLPKELKDALEHQKLVMFLGVHNHKIAMQDDGSVLLSVYYIASVESKISFPPTSNILFAGPESKKRIEQLEKDISQLSFDVENKLVVDVNNFVLTAEGIDAENSTANNNQKIDKLKKAREEREGYDNSKKSIAYRRILNGLYTNKLLHVSFVKRDFIDKAVKAKNRGGDVTNETAAADIARNIEARNSQKANSIMSDELSLKSGVSSLLGTNEVGDDKFGAALMDNLATFPEEALTDTELHKVIYFYLGDLLEIVLEGMFKKHPTATDNVFNKDVKFMLGPLTFYDYGELQPRQPGVLNEKEGKDLTWTGKISSVNIADIPISLREFSRWFVDTIVKQGLELMDFKSFLDSLIQELVINALSTECYEFAPKQQARIVYKPFTAPVNEKRTQIFQESTRTSVKKLEETPFNSVDYRTMNEKMDLEDYVLIYGTVENPYQLTGDYDDDLKRGIYHLFYGNDRGLVKKIDFERDDNPALRSANIAHQFNAASSPAAILREKYDANVDMIGNNLFTAGSMLHITPSIGGSGNLTLRLKQITDLGIGGYFQVITVKNEIEAGKFSTTLDTKWTSPGDGTANDGTFAVNKEAGTVSFKIQTSTPKSEEVKATEGDISVGPLGGGSSGGGGAGRSW